MIFEFFKDFFHKNLLSFAKKNHMIHHKNFNNTQKKSKAHEFSFINKIPIFFFYLLFYRISSLAFLLSETRETSERKFFSTPTLIELYVYVHLNSHELLTNRKYRHHHHHVIGKDERGLSRIYVLVAMTNHSIHYVNEKTISKFMEQLLSVQMEMKFFLAGVSDSDEHFDGCKNRCDKKESSTP